MQQIKGILLVDNGVGHWVDEYGRIKNPLPTITLGVLATLVIDLRAPFSENDDEDNLPPYPISEFDGLGLCFAMDNDYDESTDPPLIKTSGITIASVNGKTILTIPLPNTNTPSLNNVIKAAPSTSFICELTGLNSSNQALLSIEMSFGMKNRVYKPEDAMTGEETPDPEDPEWIAPLTPIIASKVQEAIDALTFEDGISSYTYFGYASNANGADFSLTPGNGLYFRAEFVSSAFIGTPTLADFQSAGAVFHQYIIPGAAGSSSRLYVAYASDAAGAGFSLTPGENLRYRAEFVSSAVIATPTLSDFSAAGATFLKYMGEDGIPGAGFVNRGVWSAGTYAKNELVLYQGGWMLSLVDGNNTTPPSPPASNGYWQTIVASGTNGKDVSLAFSATGDGQGTDWHSEMSVGDKYYRISVNNGVTWSIPRLLSLPPVGVKIQFTASASPLSPSWGDLSYNPENDYSTAQAAYFRYKMAGSVWSDSVLIINLSNDATAEEIAEAEARLLGLPVMVQFSNEGEEESDWHGTLLEGDRYIRFYNSTGTVRVVWDLSGYDVDIEGVQVSTNGGHWHSTIQSADVYMRLSLDGGLTYMSPWPFRAQDGKSAYQEWLDAGNSGSREDFLVSLKGQDGLPGTPGSGLHFDASGTLADRSNYDSTQIGFVYLASDGIDNGNGTFSAALFQRSSATQGVWSSPVPVTPGPKGDQGNPSTVPGPRGADASLIPDYEFTGSEIVSDINYGNYLLLQGIKAIAQVELYDAAGDGIVIERGDAAENGKCLVKTRYSENKTVIYFGELDVSRGGRVRFAHGNIASSIVIGNQMLPGYQLLVRPLSPGNVHLQVKAGIYPELSKADSIIDTTNVDGRNNVLYFDGFKWYPFPQSGLGFSRRLAPIRVDLSSVPRASFLFYRWLETGQNPAWQSTYYPSNPFPGGIPEEITGAGTGWPETSGETSGILTGTGLIPVTEEPPPPSSGTSINTGLQTSQTQGTQEEAEPVFCPALNRTIPAAQCTGTCVLAFGSCPVCGELYISSACLAGSPYSNEHVCPGTGGGSGAATNWEPPQPEIMWCMMTQKYIPVESCIGNCTFPSGTRCPICGDYLQVNCKGDWWQILPHSDPPSTGMTGWEGTGITGMTGLDDVQVPADPPAEDVQTLVNQSCKQGFQYCPDEMCLCSWFTNGDVEQKYCPECGKRLAWRYKCERGTVTKYPLYHRCGASGDYGDAANGNFYYGNDKANYTRQNGIYFLDQAIELWNYVDCIGTTPPITALSGTGTHYKIRAVPQNFIIDLDTIKQMVGMSPELLGYVHPDSGVTILTSATCDGTCRRGPAGTGLTTCFTCMGSGQVEDWVWDDILQDYVVQYLPCSECGADGIMTCPQGTLEQAMEPNSMRLIGPVVACSQCLPGGAKLTVTLRGGSGVKMVGSEWGIVVDSTTQWAKTGESIYNLPAGTFDIVFRGVREYFQEPSSPTVSLTENEVKAVTYQFTIKNSVITLVFKDDRGNIINEPVSTENHHYDSGISRVSSINWTSGSRPYVSNPKTGDQITITSGAMFAHIRFDNLNSSLWRVPGNFYNIELRPGGVVHHIIQLRPTGSMVRVAWAFLTNNIYGWKEIGHGAISELNGYYLSEYGELVYFLRTLFGTYWQHPTYRNLLTGWTDIKEYAGVMYGKRADGYWYNLETVEKVMIGGDIEAAADSKTSLTFGLSSYGDWGIDSTYLKYGTGTLRITGTVTDLSSHLSTSPSTVIFRCS